MKTFAMFLGLAAMMIVGCGQSVVDKPLGSSDATNVSLELCGKCGELTGTDACCAAGAETCGCGLHKGSPGCCNMDKGANLTLCVACGQLEGSDKCCAADGELCKCGWHKGSPACCKIAKPGADEQASTDEGDDHDHEGDEDGDAHADHGDDGDMDDGDTDDSDTDDGE